MKNKPLRGFKDLVGKTIKAIDADSVNVVHIETTDGEKFSIDAERRHCDIEIITCGKYWYSTRTN